MNFILKMAWRDTRASRRRLGMFSLSIVLGLAALVAIDSFRVNLRDAINAQARTLLGADLEVTSRAVLSPEAETFVAGLGGEKAREISLATMVVFPDREARTRLISLRALDDAFPYYGKFEASPANAVERFRAGGRVAILEESLLSQYGVAVGDRVRLGQAMFTIVGALKAIPGESAAVALLSPRVYIPFAEMADTALIGPGSLVRYKTYFRFGDEVDVEAMVADLRERFRELRLGFDTVEERKRELGNAVRNVYAFLGIVGLVALLLGGIGVGSAMQVYVRQKLGTVAILRCLGASGRQAFYVYLVQGLALGFLGAVIGAALGVGVQLAIPLLVADFLPFQVEFTVVYAAIGRGLAAGVVIGGLFTLLPLLGVRRVSPLAAIRSSLLGVVDRPDPWRWAVYGAITLVVTYMAVKVAPSARQGLGLVVGLGVAFAVLGGVAQGIIWAARRWIPAGLPYVWRQGMANLHRPNNRTVLLVLALGLGTFLVVTLALTRLTLLTQFANSDEGGGPNLLFFDVQDDQVAPLREILAAVKAPLLAEAPIVAMRIAAINDRPVAEILKDANGVPSWTLRREYRSTFRGQLSATEQLIGGTFTGQVEADVDVVPVSVEEGLLDDMQLGLGDFLTFDVQGVPLRTQVTSVRRVEWRRLEPNFFVVFPLGVLEPAPKFFVVATRADSPADSARVQQAVIQALPNVSAIDLALLLATLDGIFSKVEAVIQFMALFTAATGLIVLVGAILTGKAQRLRETVLLRTIGASARQLQQIQLVEYALLGGLAALLGCGLAWGASAGLALWVFETPVVFAPATMAIAGGAVVALTLVTGTLANRGLTHSSPLAILRAEG